MPDRFPPFDRFLTSGAGVNARAPVEWFREGYMQALRDLGVRYGRPTPSHAAADIERLVEGGNG